jgi:hypothetical protein
VLNLVLFDTSLESESVTLYLKFQTKINHLDESVVMEKNKIQNKQSSVTSIKWLCACCVNCARLPMISELRHQKELKKIASE